MNSPFLHCRHSTLLLCHLLPLSLPLLPPSLVVTPASACNMAPPIELPIPYTRRQHHIPAKRCQLPPDVGWYNESCDQSPWDMHFYFRQSDADSLVSPECYYDVFNGCGGNGNRFGTLEECERACVGHVVHARGEMTGWDA